MCVEVATGPLKKQLQALNLFQKPPGATGRSRPQRPTLHPFFSNPCGILRRVRAEWILFGNTGAHESWIHASCLGRRRRKERDGKRKFTTTPITTFFPPHIIYRITHGWTGTGGMGGITQYQLYFLKMLIGGGTSDPGHVPPGLEKSMVLI
jgi:hypothetical protein